MATTPTISKPQISIIVPFYNVEDYARKCIESLIAQTLRDIEIILVDDGSPDNCGAICDEYASADPRIKVIHKKNGGLSSARNAGLDIATADVIGFVDSDDWVEPEMYEKMLSAMKETGADIAVCDIVFDYLNNATYNNAAALKKAFTVDQTEALKLLLDDKVFRNHVWNKIFSRKVITDKFPVGVTLEDIYTTIRYFANADKVCYIPFVGYHYIQRIGSILHVYSTERSINYLNAIKFQLDFIKTKGLLPEKWLDYSCRFIIEGIKEARNMARNMPWSMELQQAFSCILRMIEPFREECFAMLPSKTKKRWERLTKHPRLFYHSMRIGQKFQLKNNYKRRNYEYYE